MITLISLALKLRETLFAANAWIDTKLTHDFVERSTLLGDEDA